LPTWIRLCALSGLAIAAFGADTGAQDLFNKVRAKVAANSRSVPRYTCVETINRTEYRPQYGAAGASCKALIAARDALTSPGYVTWRDRLRLDVAVLNGRETFSWAGAQQFETTDLRQLIASGSSGSGDFAAFLATVFGAPGIEVAFLGGDVFRFRVPLASSGYRYRSRGSGAERTTAYHGTFKVDPARADLKQLTVDADEFPPEEPLCRARDVMDYQRLKIGDGDFLLPERSTMTVLFSNGKESHNETTYADCREYKGESTIRFDDAPAERTAEAQQVEKKLPSHVKLQLGLQVPIDSDTAAAGDPVTAVVLRNAKGVKAGDTVHGRIVRLEQSMFPKAQWLVVFQMDGMRTLKDSFTFGERGKLVLDSKFHFECETR